MRANAHVLAAQLQSARAAVALAFAFVVVTVTIYRVIPFSDVNLGYLLNAQQLAAGQLLPANSFARLATLCFSSGRSSSPELTASYGSSLRSTL
jgi:hypothetical protein